jgi:hypothetical protein
MVNSTHAIPHAWRTWLGKFSNYWLFPQSVSHDGQAAAR